MKLLKWSLAFAFCSSLIVISPVRSSPLQSDSDLPEAASGDKQSSQEEDAVTLDAVNVFAAEGDMREVSLLATLSVGRDEIALRGDTALADVLRRLPGITVDGGKGQGTQVRMRGLGSGYTQILINGDPAPAGFTIDSISPEAVERIDIMRSATADMSSQGVAGTINIVLRKHQRKVQRELKVGLIDGAGGLTHLAAARVAGGSDRRTYSVGVTSNAEKFLLDARIEEWGATDGTSDLRRTTSREGDARVRTFNLTPSVSWKLSEDNSLSWENLISQSRVDGRNRDRAVTAFGALQTYPNNDLRFNTDTTTVQSKGVWSRQIGAYSKLETRLGVTAIQRDSGADFTGFEEDNTLVLHRTVRSEVRDASAIFGGKLTTPFSDQHGLGLGWDGEFGRREEDRIQRDITPTGLPPLNLDEKYDARVSRLALFAQDEWQILPNWSIYLGVRWEKLRTYTEGNVIAPVDNSFSVISPTIQTVWKLADDRRDQVRMALGRTYKSPQIAELIPRRYISNNNSATMPDTQGNPDLRPELAWGLDLAYERYWGSANSFSASVYARRLEDVILPDLSNVDGTWISVPRNNGQADVRGIEVDAKVGLDSLIAAASGADLRFNVGKNWSSVDNVPGPDNRLNRQSPLSANFGVDYRAKRVPLTVGGNYNYRDGGTYQLSRVQGARDSTKRIVDLYGLWKFNEVTQLRVSAANVLHQDGDVDATFSDSSIELLQRTTTPSYMTFNATLEIKL